MLKYRDQILIEVTGHDHLSDFRTHSATKLFNRDDNCMDTNEDGASNDYFLGKMISPSITPGSNTNPGYTTMLFDTESMNFE